MENNLKPLQYWSRSIVDIIAELFRSRLWFGVSDQVLSTTKIAADFFAINIASSNDPASDDYVIEALNELGIKHVRMGFSYDSLDNHGQRLLDRTIAEGFHVMLNIFPPREEAEQLDSSTESQKRWHDFTQNIFDLYHDKVESFEIGNTTNRKKWSGFSASSFLQAWNIASPLADQFQIKIAGPNVSDFEPFYNMAYLNEMQRLHRLPAIHTDNLFVERVLEPEAFDHRVLGNWASNFLKLNLIKKARIIDRIGKRLGCFQTFCTYTCWTVKRLERRNNHPEQKQADYLIRYLVLAAASGALNRVYWGPLICGRDGLIDCGADHNTYPEIDNVAYYKELRGEVENFRRRTAFYSLQNIVSRLSDSILIQGVSGENGISHFVFLDQNKNETHICWCRDGYAFPLSDLYPEKLEQVIFYDSGITPLESAPLCITEQPLFIQFSSEKKSSRPKPQQIKSIPNLMIKNIVAGMIKGKTYHPFENNNWQGAMMIDNDCSFEQACDQLLPESLEQAEVLRVLRDSRNKIWNIPGRNNNELSVKLNRTTGFKRFSYRFQNSKAKRHWNNGSNMLRRNINTPQPIAFFERKENSGIENSYYVTDFIENAFSSRDVFSSINKGEEKLNGIDNEFLLKEIATFICRMHNQGILHRDLSSGNLLLTYDDQNQKDQKLKLFLIDIGRAKILTTLTKRQRLIDLMRINYKLTWPGREKFMIYYQDHYGKELVWWRRAVRYYEWKQRTKKSLKKQIKKFKKKK